MTYTKSLHLAFVYHVPFWEKDGEIWTTFPPIGRYVDSLAPHFKKVTIASPKPLVSDQPLYRMKASNLAIFTVKPHPNLQSYYFHLVSFYISYLRAAPDWDLVNVRMPTLTGYPAYLAARFYHKPVFLVVVGENLNFLSLASYSGIKKWAINIIARLQDFLMKRMIRNSLTFTNGEDLFKKFKPYNEQVYPMRSSTISQSDLLPDVRDTCCQTPFRILTVATVAPRKGTVLIPEIIAALKYEGIDISWTYIGNTDGNAGEQELEKTLKLACELGVSSQIRFHKAVGFDELVSFYRSSDIFVLPTYMEGVPRVILEAQASGLPVITTSVGGIPQAVENGIDAILTSPGNLVEIVAAIQKVIQDPNFRRGLISKGLETAQKFTLESETKRMLDKVEEVCFTNEKKRN